MTTSPIVVCSDGSGAAARATWAWVRADGQWASGQCTTPSDARRAELTAALEALRATPPGSEVHLRTDSQDALRILAPSMLVTGFDLGGMPEAREELHDLVGAFEELATSRVVVGHWVRGHHRDALNIAADLLAGWAARGLDLDPSGVVRTRLRKWGRKQARLERDGVERQCEDCGALQYAPRAARSASWGSNQGLALVDAA